MTDFVDVAFEEDIAPWGPRRLDEQTVRLGSGGIWRVHKDDHYPPHAHNVETGQRINLVTGDVIDAKGKPTGHKVNGKHLARLNAALH
jgi:hypothetical protein